MHIFSINYKSVSYTHLDVYKRQEEAIEFILAGASAVAVGSAALVNPYAPIHVKEGIESYMKDHLCEDISKIRGRVIAY